MAIAEQTAEAAHQRKISPAWGAVCFAICAATYIVNAADRTIFPALLPALDADYGLSLPLGSFLATIYLIGLGAGGIGTGYLLDRISRKASMLAGILVYSAFTVMTVRALGFADMALYRIATGIGEAMQSVALIIAVCAFYPASRTFANGVVQCALGFGQFIGPRLGALLLAQTGNWRVPFYGFGALGLAGAAALLLVSPGFTERKLDNSSPAASDAHLPERLWNQNVICVLLAILFRSMSFFAFFGLYATFLMTQLHFPLATAAAALSMFGVGPLFSPLAGHVADRINQKLFQIVCFAVMAMAEFVIFNVARTTLTQEILSLIEGVAGGFAYINGYSLAQRSVKNTMIGRVSGFYYAASTLPAAVSGLLLAKLVEALGWRFGASLMMSALLLIAIGISLFIDTRLVSGRARRLTTGRRLWA
jgi:MFS family permease